MPFHLIDDSIGWGFFVEVAGPGGFFLHITCVWLLPFLLRVCLAWSSFLLLSCLPVSVYVGACELPLPPFFSEVAAVITANRTAEASSFPPSSLHTVKMSRTPSAH